MKKTSPSNYAPHPDRMRRAVMIGLASASVAAWVPRAFSQSATNTDTPTSPTSPASQRAFLSVSQFLTGRTTLNDNQAQRLLNALAAADPAFLTKLAALSAFIDTNHPEPTQLQAALDAQKASFAGLPRDLLTAWYVGVVGSATHAQCLTYSTALMNVAVSDHLRPPSYAYGSYGSWASKPL